METLEQRTNKEQENERPQGNLDTAYLEKEQKEARIFESKGFEEANRLRDEYKQKTIELALSESIPFSSIKEMPAVLREELDEKLAQLDEKYTINGIHFLKVQFADVWRDYELGIDVEYEAFGPYLKDYLQYIYDETTEDVEFTKTDLIGLRILKSLKEEFPKGRLISLFDEYNLGVAASTESGKPVDPHTNEGKSTVERNIKNIEKSQLGASEAYRQKFKEFVERVLREQNIIGQEQKEGVDGDYLLVSETEKIKDAEELVKVLEQKGLIEYGEGEEIWYQNTVDKCEDPRYLRINLRNKEGKWQCAALDASGFLDERNRERTHVVILPKENFEEQQDQVFEILHTLGFKPAKYHNVFYDKGVSPEVASETIKKQIELHKGHRLVSARTI